MCESPLPSSHARRSASGPFGREGPLQQLIDLLGQGC